MVDLIARLPLLPLAAELSVYEMLYFGVHAALSFQ